MSITTRRRPERTPGPDNVQARARSTSWPPAESGLFDAWRAASVAWDVWAASRASGRFIAQRTRTRLGELLAASRASPLYRRLHGERSPACDDLASLPSVTRAELMADFDAWCTDRAIDRATVTAFLADPDRVGAPLLGRYAVWTSSGTTGVPGVYVHDARALAVYDALEAIRFRGLGDPGGFADAFARMVAAPWGGAERYAMVAATGGHFAGTATVERLRRLAPWVAARTRVVSIMQPLADLLAQLDDWQPSVLATYPTSAELLAEQQAAGMLHLRLNEVWTGGEHLSPTVRERIARVFDCPVRDGYGASEFMAIGRECRHGTMHVNSDWVLLEPVDRHHRPVPTGQASHTVLLTNLANHVQPLIRYDLGDSITPLPPCPCGSAFPAIRVEGRTDDVLEFATPDHARTVKLLPLALVTVLEDDAGVFEFQLAQTGAHTLALRLAACVADRARTRRACHEALRRFLERNGLGHLSIRDDPSDPRRHPVSGKLRRVVRESARPVERGSA